MAQQFSPWLLLCALLLMVVVLGFFLPPASIILMTAPIILPPLRAAGFDLVWFGVVMTIVMEMGLIHPPVGLNLYVASGITKMGITELTVAVWPWLLTMLTFLALVTYWPALSLWLPRMLGMM